VVLFIVLELILKFARAKIMDTMVIGVDQQWARDIFQRLLSIRVDQLPNSVGSLAAQIRAYEQVRSFYTANTLFHLAELPIALIFLILIAALGTTELAVVPCVAVMVAVMVGAYAKRRVDVLAAQGLAVTHRKTGLLVETVEGIETIKSGVGSWRFLSRWLDVTQHSIGHDLALRHNSDALQYGVAAIQQLSYVAMIMVGALAVIEQHMSIGALIACSILSGRVLSPILSLPQLMVQRAQAKAAILGLEQLYALNVDNQGIARPLTPQRLHGHYRLDQVNFAYPQRPNALRIPQLQIKAGERIAIIGAIGSGKSTLLKLLAGLYQPEQGSVLIDGLDMQHLHPHTRGEHIGYLQQEHRLFEGTLRDNLWIGLPDQGDAVLYAAMQRSGLIQLVSGHPRGLDLPISEGGKGLSGGQKQLVAFTRLLLGQPQILLLDEPTASLDSVQEQRCIRILSEQLQATQPTLVLVTHKHALLPLVDRIIVMAGHTIVMDGAREQILQQLRQLPTAQPPSTPEMNA
jgi:ATP-binding cassette subfamily C protein LapB